MFGRYRNVAFRQLHAAAIHPYSPLRFAVNQVVRNPSIIPNLGNAAMMGGMTYTPVAYTPSPVKKAQRWTAVSRARRRLFYAVKRKSTAARRRYYKYSRRHVRKYRRY